VGFLPPLVALLVLVVLLVVIARVLGSRITIYDHEVGLLYVSGMLRRSLGPGGHWILQPFAEVRKLDLRPRVVTVPGQEVLTSDNVSIKTSLLLRYRIEKPELAVQSATSFEEVLYADAQVALREIVGGMAIESLVSERLSLGTALEERLRPKATALGLLLESAGLKDLIFPPLLRQVFHQVVEARKASQASLERARGEVATLRSLANAARMLENNPALLALRTLETVSTGKHTLVMGAPSVLPIPSAGGVAAGPRPSEEGGVETEE